MTDTGNLLSRVIFHRKHRVPYQLGMSKLSHVSNGPPCSGSKRTFEEEGLDNPFLASLSILKTAINLNIDTSRSQCRVLSSCLKDIEQVR
jgi:hypothetical protein